MANRMTPDAHDEFKASLPDLIQLMQTLDDKNLLYIEPTDSPYIADFGDIRWYELEKFTVDHPEVIQVAGHIIAQVKVANMLEEVNENMSTITATQLAFIVHLIKLYVERNPA